MILRREICLFFLIVRFTHQFNQHLLRAQNRFSFSSSPRTTLTGALRLRPGDDLPPPPPPYNPGDEPNWFEPEPDGMEDLKDVFIDAAQVRRRCVDEQTPIRASDS